MASTGTAAGGSSSSFAVNGAIMVAQTSIINVVNSTTTYRSKNDGNPQPDSIRLFGFSQSQIDKTAPSIITSRVILTPGKGSPQKQLTFVFTTTLNEEGNMDGEEPFYLFNKGDGEIGVNQETGMGYLIPNGVKSIAIGLYPRTPENPPVWYIEIISPWFSISTMNDTQRVSATFTLMEVGNSEVTSNKVIQGPLRRNPLFPPSKPLRQIG